MNKGATSGRCVASELREKPQSTIEPPVVTALPPPHLVFSVGLDGACGAPRAKHFVRSGLREGGGGGGRARPPQRVRSVSLKGFDSAVRRASHPRFAQRVRSCSLKNGFWSLLPLLRQFTRSVARLASLDGVNEPFAHATGSKLLRVLARGSSVCVLARSRGESTLRRSIVLGLSRHACGVLLRYWHLWSPELCAGCGRVGPGWTDGAASEYVLRPVLTVRRVFFSALAVLYLALVII
ncbi:unnamed protein product [Pelagomonas calceolata]|uniref:Uncharacterized protein n=1 Tax=Pelagomonas calceolata TaxID=35677 RepID=A0A8J2WY20_9STRA|nr:unnamed protein product [Pelagomonas calceolata]